MAQDTDVFSRLERFYDAVPRTEARAEQFGGLVLFVRDGKGWPYYARPKLSADTPSAADITAVRQRQRELGVPEAFEWVHETTPDLLAIARSAGLEVLLAPLMVLETAALVPDLPVNGAGIRLVDPHAAGFAQDVAASRAVAQLGFGEPHTGAPRPGAVSAGLSSEPDPASIGFPVPTSPITGPGGSASASASGWPSPASASGRPNPASGSSGPTPASASGRPNPASASGGPTPASASGVPAGRPGPDAAGRPRPDAGLVGRSGSDTAGPAGWPNAANGSLVTEPAGPAARDAVPPPDADVVEAARQRALAGRAVTAVVESPTHGILATGMVQRVGDVAEIAGVATLPSARRLGYASQLTATLARWALNHDVRLVFLSAGDDDAARLYSKVGFRRIGTACIAEPAAAF